MESRHTLMPGIYPGCARGSMKPAIDGIVTGIPYAKNVNSNVKSVLEMAKPSATQFSPGVFGAGRTIQGKGDAKGSMAHDSDSSMASSARSTWCSRCGSWASGRRRWGS
jgi:hypothetical protein